MIEGATAEDGICDITPGDSKENMALPKSEPVIQRTMAIGDVHGCLTALDTLLGTLQVQSEDRLVFLGDYVDRGPDSRGVVHRLIELKERCHLVALMGNHEEMVWTPTTANPNGYPGDSSVAKKPWNPMELWSQDGRLPKEHLDFLRSCPMFFETETHIFVHADYYPNRPMREQSSTTLLWSFFHAETAAPHYSRKTVILGHTPAAER